MTDARRICRGVKSVFVPGALETADIATIRPSFRGEKEAGSVEGGERRGGAGGWKEEVKGGRTGRFLAQ